MSWSIEPRSSSRVVGLIFTGLIILFMLFDAGCKFLRLSVVDDTMMQLGFPLTAAFPIGVISLICVILYALPLTSILGAVLLTAIYGGAIATQLRVGNPIFSHLLFGVYLGLLTWGGVYLRSSRLRAIFPFVRRST